MKIRRAHFALGAGAEHVVAGSPWAALWTFPAMIGAAFVVAWGAEAAEFLMSQGLALAILALIQTMPEFAVEAVIAWKAGKNPDMVHLAIANFTGSLRLLTGFGWPMIYAVAAFSSRRKRGKPLGTIRFEDDHAVEVLGLLPPLAYFVVVWAKGNLSLIDAAVLAATYVLYLVVLLRLPPRAETLEQDEEVPAVSRWALSFRGAKRWLAVGGLFVAGRRDHRARRGAVPELDARHRRQPRRLAVRLHPVGGAVHLGVSRRRPPRSPGRAGSRAPRSRC